ncbi:MAG TPA: hypothetical protein VNX25_07005 [Verrucomicrobiae bacterium]|nr:hypothetical protein [Verrucomicrobiae bacterium]
MGSTFSIQEIAFAASSAMERLGLGSYRLEGAGNIFRVATWQGWNSMVNELTRQGFILVTSSEYAEIVGLSDAEVGRRIGREGSLFALLYQSGPLVHCAVPLDERDDPEDPTDIHELRA